MLVNICDFESMWGFQGADTNKAFLSAYALACVRWKKSDCIHTCISLAVGSSLFSSDFRVLLNVTT